MIFVAESQTLPELLTHPDFWIVGSLTLPPMQAAAIMLPILVVQDIVSLWAYRGDYDRKALKVLLIGAIIGTAIATMLVPQAAITLIVGQIALWFAAQFWLRRLPGVKKAPSIRKSNAHSVFWGTICGITSFIAYAVAPSAQAHRIPFRLSPLQFVGTLSYLFAAINLIKLGPVSGSGSFPETT